jgi:hypothetical protein
VNALLRLNRILAVVFVGLGLALVAVTAYHGGGSVGFLLGGVFVVLGVLRWRVTHPR